MIRSLLFVLLVSVAARADEPFFFTFVFNSPTSAAGAAIADRPVRVIDDSGKELMQLSILQYPAWRIFRAQPGRYTFCWDNVPGFRSDCKTVTLKKAYDSIAIDLYDYLLDSYIEGYVSSPDTMVDLIDDKGTVLQTLRAVGHPRVFSHFVFGGVKDGDYVVRARYQGYTGTRRVSVVNGKPVEDVGVRTGHDD